MKVLLFAAGSRGDVQPLVALAKALETAGHEAALVTPAACEHFVKQNDVRTIPLKDRYWNTSKVDPEFARKALRKRSFFRRAVKLGRKGRIDGMEPLNEIRSACSEGADVVVHQTLNVGRNIAEWLDAPAVPVILQPFWIRTGLLPQWDFPMQVPRAINRLTYKWSDWHIRALDRARYNGELARWRREELGLRRGYQWPFRSPVGDPRLVLQAFSRHVLPSPLDYPEWVHTTGYWFLSSSSDWTPSRQLSKFITEDEPPIYVGLGTAGGWDPRRTTRVLVEALRRARVRAVVNTSSGGIVADELEGNVMAIEDVPYDWLFPRMAAIVHAGGSGTTASALASGRPQVVCPIRADQPFWAHRMHVSGVAPPPLADETLTPDSLAQSIRCAVTDQTIRASAEEIGRRVREEDGLTAAVKVLESIV